VVPATPLSDQDVGIGPGPGAGPSLQERAYALARQRLDAASDRFRALGATVDGEVGDADPLEAARSAHRRFGADEVIVCTLPLGVSRWLRGNLPRKVERSLGVPVVHLVEPGEVA
jgi:nucleotide-binding universal stress UspA family protein